MRETMILGLVLTALAAGAPGQDQEQEETDGIVLAQTWRQGDRCRIEERARTRCILRSRGPEWGNRKHPVEDDTRRVYVQTVEAYEAGKSLELRRVYEIAEKTSRQPNSSKRVAVELSAAGQGVEVVIDAAGFRATGEDRLLESPDQESIRRWYTMLPYLPGEPVEVGDEWDVDRSALGHLFYGPGFNEREFMARGRVQLRRVRKVRGRDVAECALEVHLQNKRIGDYPAMKIDAEGLFLWDIEAGRLLSMSWKGPLELETASDDIEVVGEGTYEFEIEVRWLDD